jgi:hypothetical protein
MRQLVSAVDIQPGDHIVQVGKVESVIVLGDNVIFTLNWAVRREHRLALDAYVWIDREEAA